MYNNLPYIDLVAFKIKKYNDKLKVLIKKNTY